MSITQIIHQECKVCNSFIAEESRLKVSKTIIIKLICGHIIRSEFLASKHLALMGDERAKLKEFGVHTTRDSMAWIRSEYGLWHY